MQNVSSELQKVSSELLKSEDWNCREDGTTKPSRNVSGVSWRLTDGRWTLDRPEVRVDPRGARDHMEKDHKARG